MLEKLLHFDISAVYLEFQNVFLTDEVLYILNIFCLNCKLRQCTFYNDHVIKKIFYFIFEVNTMSVK